MDIKDSANEGWEGSEEHGRENIHSVRELLLTNYWWKYGQKGFLSEGGYGNVKCVIGRWKEGRYLL